MASFDSVVQLVWSLLVMYPSLGSARFGSVLARAFKEKARLGSARLTTFLKKLGF